ncbi:MAG: hypothetical protein ACNA7N_06080 [Yoonia sp.]
MIYRILMLSCLSAPAWAACPVADDLANGIRLMADDGAVETYRKIAPHMVELTVTYDDDFADRSLLGQGVYILELSELYNGKPEPDTTLIYTYPVAADAMPVPAPGVVWRTRALVGGSDEEKITASWGQPQQMTFGACSYTVIPGELVYAGADYREVEGLHYLPELGFAYLASVTSDDDEYVDEYVILSITAVGPDE